MKGVEGGCRRDKCKGRKEWGWGKHAGKKARKRMGAIPEQLQITESRISEMERHPEMTKNTHLIFKGC